MRDKRPLFLFGDIVVVDVDQIGVENMGEQ